MENNFQRILFLDIETSPNLAYVWEKYEQDVISFEKERELLSFAYQWNDKKNVKCCALCDFEKNKQFELVSKLHSLFDKADIIVAHNGDEFDIKMSCSFFAHFNLKPPKPYKTIDTLKIARKKFRFNSNKLDDLGEYLGVGRKMETGGFKLWLGCLRGDKKSWDKMKKYNKGDVVLLEKVYNKLIPWDTNRININNKEGFLCPACGSSNLQARGWNIALKYKTQRFHCQNCGKWSHGAKEKFRSSVLN
jgi:uncharacterized protein YprB with RNaseH-like and TPR domain/predicted RNA-binding Zn-ribbon protein involved in translation (DUF1610 family)